MQMSVSAALVENLRKEGKEKEQNVHLQFLFGTAEEIFRLERVGARHISETDEQHSHNCPE